MALRLVNATDAWFGAMTSRGWLPMLLREVLLGLHCAFSAAPTSVISVANALTCSSIAMLMCVSSPTQVHLSGSPGLLYAFA